ncbi:TrkA family potassium uptake protein [Aminivibrio sp.]|uniref:potassium channel family protein n=1 Tax=Aminivibrio sp. TaxID=1872489 RepID=UPI001A529823|nr:TrkA family potassium uptake protein [Aminivibrio sp.]MBL3539041.1 TrkA family potassium uptake protein [Aminivibrio sp.]MDK2958963.1 trk/ktr system potassium uptake protein [Synergistaceae bacterium]
MKKKVVLVIGLGRFGKSLCKTLSEFHNQIIAVDNDNECVEETAGLVDMCVQADATDAEALAKCGAKEADVAVVAIGESVEASILATTSLKDLGVPYIIARAENDIHARVLARVGANRVIFPERDMGERLAQLLVLPWMSHFAQVPGSLFYVGEIRPNPEMTGKTLAELDFRVRYNAVILTINRGGKRFIPRAETTIESGDMILVAGQREDLRKWVEE